MKTSLLIEAGVTRLFLVPESEDDKSILAAICKERHIVQIYAGAMSQILGGWDKIGNGDDGLVLRISRDGTGEMKKRPESGTRSSE